VKCREVNKLLCDYLDGAAAVAEGRALEEHAASCNACRETLDEARFAQDYMRRAPMVEPPPELIGDIIHQTTGIGESVPAMAGGSSQAPLPLWGWLRPLVHPLTHPRFAMSMAMTFLSFSMAGFHGKEALERWEAPTITPAAIVEGAGEALDPLWAGAAQLYESLVLFYAFPTEFGWEAEPPAAIPDQRQREGPAQPGERGPGREEAQP
jgi:hypothetical protein